ncbi:unnamed protein product, partial [Prorocentrum cordatum]
SAFPRLPEPARALGPRAPEKKQKKTLAALAPEGQLARGDTARLPARGGPSSTARAPRAARGDDVWRAMCQRSGSAGGNYVDPAPRGHAGAGEPVGLQGPQDTRRTTHR